MSNFIEEFYYGNIEPQSLSTEITPKLKKKLSALVKKEEELTEMLPEKEKELIQLRNYVCRFVTQKSLFHAILNCIQTTLTA